MVWTDDALMLGLESELYLMRSMTTTIAGGALRPDGKEGAYAIAMSFIRIAGMIGRLSPDFKCRYPAVPWEDVWSVGNRYARYPLSIDVDEMMAHVEGIDDFHEKVQEIIDECADVIPY